MEKKFLRKINRYLFLVLLITCGITFFTRNNYQSVHKIVPELLNPPLQKEIYNTELIKFTKHGYNYELTPLYDYEINGLITREMNYRLFNIYNFDKIFPMDLCLIWGDNLRSGVYRNRAIKFSQDCRCCYVRWYGNIDFNFSEMSNNHLLINHPDLEKKIKTLLVGDQIKIKGKLVNVNAIQARKLEKLDPQEYSWKTSVNRTDTGMGACEIIYVEDIEILKKANIISYYLFRLSFYGLIIIIFWNVFSFFALPFN